ncbi:MAG: glycosyltransferase family 25 protein [Prochloron sp. SP5CPC1]|nr:glycosyltransferase family 25 protein [Candidatus Paraprochloron terpiosi SP5CPC1]
MLQVCVLNLKRRSDRREKFQQLNRQSDIQFVWVEAIEGRELDISQLIEQGLLFRQYEHFTPGQLGNAMSHRMLWQQCVEKDTPLIICEDDAVLRQDFAAGFTHIYQQLPATWDCVFFGYNFDSILDIEIIPGVNLQGSFFPPGLSQANQQAFVATTVMPSLLPLNNVLVPVPMPFHPKEHNN